tara:strand:+ start:119 stop:358 length:240 start_codon:yes stop_codon:yes gene_type:complete
MIKRIRPKEVKGQPRSYIAACNVSRAERAEIAAAAKEADLRIGDLTRMCTLHIIREGTLEVHTQVKIATTDRHKEVTDD